MDHKLLLNLRRAFTRLCLSLREHTGENSAPDRALRDELNAIMKELSEDAAPTGDAEKLPT